MTIMTVILRMKATARDVLGRHLAILDPPPPSLPVVDFSHEDRQEKGTSHLGMQLRLSGPFISGRRICDSCVVRACGW